MKQNLPKFRVGRKARSIAMFGIGAVIAALLSVAGGTSAAFADGTASVSGTVTDASTSAPISGAYVQIESQDQTYVNYVQTGGDGTYTLPDLDAGSYTLSFQAPDGTNYLSNCWKDVSCNDPDNYTYFDVADGATLTGYDAQLSLGASISGTVDGSDNPGVGVSGIQISVQSTDGNGNFGFATTDDNGNYTVTGLAPDSYVVDFQPNGTNYLEQYWRDAADYEHATPVVVGSGDNITDINATLAAGQTISGTVTDPAGNPLANVSVSASAPSGVGSGDATTDASGNYTISGLVPGQYVVGFQPTSGNLIQQYWNNEPDYQSANLVTVPTGSDVTGINAQLARGATISGTVTTAAGPLAHAIVTAFPTNSIPNAGPFIAKTNADGNYKIIGLEPGTYTVQFTPPAHQNLTVQWWNDAFTQSDATPVTTSTSSPATGIDATMSTGATISGHVWAPGAPGSPRVGEPNTSVEVFDANGEIVGTGGTDANGHYKVDDLAPGTYSVEFITGEQSGVVSSEWWGGTFIETGAKTLTLTDAQSLTNISQRLITGSPITGTVTDGGTSSISQAVIYIWPSDQVYGAPSASDQIFQVTTDADGNYTLPNMGPGKYTIEFESLDPHFSGQWYNDKPSQAKANWVVVQKNVPVSGIDAVLAPVIITPGTPTISGKARVGETLTAHPGNWKPSNMTFSYQWLDNGNPITDATAITYVPTADEVGDSISVAVTGTTVAYESQGISQTVDSASTNPIKGPSNLQ